MAANQLSVADNPQPRPIYPGKWNRNNKAGSLLTKEEWMQDQAKLWVQKMQEKPLYKKTHLSKKALLLASYLPFKARSHKAKVIHKPTSRSQENSLCQKMITTAELQLQQEGGQPREDFVETEHTTDDV